MYASCEKAPSVGYVRNHIRHRDPRIHSSIHTGYLSAMRSSGPSPRCFEPMSFSGNRRSSLPQKVNTTICHVKKSTERSEIKFKGIRLPNCGEIPYPATRRMKNRPKLSENKLAEGEQYITIKRCFRSRFQCQSSGPSEQASSGKKIGRPAVLFRL